ncbi:TrkA C-terminal domain-containing protein [Bacillus sp. V33-4]|uniref:TrkA C-terminal domain-containing protein n=1 Tax=Bacillus sp. V33-4 TaxID=2054169 RepID=UPI000C78484B|nr:TrkA C-terminal domain-containing protein [Bacillus sp. V33-4]PLR87076.1 hypothetical protein CVD23_04450 [Bacillus sp. V33-4]
MGFLFILIYIAIILAVIEINVTLFILTGLEPRVARFQVISMLTATGFTTGESELIIDHPIRRKLSTFLILFGAFSLAVIISTISSILSDNFYAVEAAYVVGVLIFILMILKTPLLKRKLEKLFEHDLEEHYDISELPIQEVLLTNEDDQLFELALYEESPAANKKIADILSPDDDIMILFIQRGEIKIMRNNCNKEDLQPGDDIILYGNKQHIKQRFNKDIEIAENRKKEELSEK